ncbi:MAG TPA: hypothetical protein VKY31_03205 [Terriglobia bacterium]|nr:hypothetical protein [Terriglobia bacterium]
MISVSNSLPVLVLRLDHYSALGAMRSLGRLGVDVYGIHAKRYSAPSRSKYCRRVFLWDLDNSPAKDSVEYLLSIADKLGSRVLLLPTNDETALFVAENTRSLEQAFVFPHNSPELVRMLYNKKEMYFLAKRLSIPTAETVFPESRRDVIEFSKRAQFPVMLKASDNIAVSRRTGKKMVIVQSMDELLSLYDRMEDPTNPTLMLQEYIPGKDDTVWMFNGYFDENSDCLFGITGRKIHQTPVYTGMTALGICLPNPVIEQTTKALVKAVGYRGILDIGYRYDARDGSYKLLDVNPRLGATFRLFVGTNDMGVVRAEYLHLTGQRVPPSDIRIGRKWIVEDLDTISCLHYFRDHALSIHDWWTGYRGIQECAWFAAEDLMPFLQMCGSFCLRPARWALNALRRRTSLPLKISQTRSLVQR